MTSRPSPTTGAPAARLQRAAVCATQLTLPRPRAGAVERPALQRRLAVPALLPLTLLAAPAGFGKTTLAARALHDLPAGWHAAWLGLERHEANVVSFLRAVVAALRSADPRLAQATASLLDAARPLPARELVLQLSDDLVQADARVVLALDDYHVVDEPAINAAVALLVEHLPAGVRLLLLTRQVPELPLAAWRARGLCSEIDAAHLRFELPEAAAFLRGTMQLELPDEAVHSLTEHAEGWIAGLQMAALSLQAHRSGDPAPAALALAFRGRHRYVTDYLAQEVLERQPDSVRAFLRRTAVLHTMCAGLCDAVTGGDDGLEQLARLDRANMFIARLDDERTWYRYHALFQEALLAELPVAELPVLHGRARAWYEAQGLHQEAFHHAWQVDDIEGCARALHHLFEPMLCRGEVRAIELMLASLPAGAFERHPELALQHAWILCITRSAELAAPYVELAGLDQAERHPPDVRGAMYTFRAYLALNWGNPAETETWAQRAIAQLPPSSTYFSVLVHTYLGQAQALQGQRVAALSTLRHAQLLGERVGNDSKALDALMHLVLLLIDQGRLLQARQLAQASIERCRDAAGRPLPVSGPAHIALGAVQFACNELDAAEQSLRAGTALTRMVGILYFELQGQCLLARLLHARGDGAGAAQLLAQAREATDRMGGPRRRQMVGHTLLDLMLLDGRADAATGLWPRTVLVAQAPAEQLLQARAQRVQGAAALALQRLALLEEADRRDGFDGHLVQVLLQQALCLQALGDMAQARAALRRALDLAAPLQLRRPFVDEAAALAPLLPELRHHAPAFVATLQPAEAGAELPSSLQSAAACVTRLSARDVELLQLLARGLRNQEIASALQITVGTTKQYLNQLFGRLGARNRVEAILLGRQLRVLK